MRSTGLVFTDGNDIKYKLIQSKLNDELLLDYNANEVVAFALETLPDVIVIEELSYNSKSSEKDLIDGNYWHIRTELRKALPNVDIKIFTVAEWRNPLFNKEERKQWTENKKKLSELEKSMKGLSRKERAIVKEQNEEIILGSNIKHLTWLKTEDKYKKEFEKFGFLHGCYDLTDSFNLNLFYRKLKK